MAVVTAHRAVGNIGDPPLRAQLHKPVLEVPLLEWVAAILHRGGGRQAQGETVGIYGFAN